MDYKDCNINNNNAVTLIYGVFDHRRCALVISACKRSRVLFLAYSMDLFSDCLFRVWVCLCTGLLMFHDIFETE